MTDVPSLAKKLGISPGSSVALVHSPKDFTLDLPEGARIRRGARKDIDVILAFFHSVDVLEREIGELATAIYPDGSLWLSWPKKSSGVVTGLNDHVVRDVVLALGLVDNKVCAVDVTYTALRFVWRRPLRLSDAAPTALQ
jgi:hypothetical protein